MDTTTLLIIILIYTSDHYINRAAPFRWRLVRSGTLVLSARLSGDFPHHILPRPLF
jgi:hypothetical protein